MIVYKSILLKSAIALLSCCMMTTKAQTVDFPSLYQPNKASISKAQEGDLWSLKNDLFTVSFVKTDGKLFFGGSEELGLVAGTELFRIQLGNGTSVDASQMALVSVETQETAGRSNAVKGADRFGRKAIVARLQYNNLSFVWKAILADGSHYLRTELSMTTVQSTQMKTLTPMIYTVKNEKGNSEPIKIGNTRGAVITSNKIFAGLETPMGINEVENALSTNFNPLEWTAGDWSTTSAAAIPKGILDKGFEASQTKVICGYVDIDAAGDLKVTFKYVSGNNRLNVVGVDLMQDGKVVASDYHIGFTGNQANANTYTVKVPTAGMYLLRYWGEEKTETINSSGSISFVGPKVTKTEESIHNPTSTITGIWSRKTTINAGDTWKVSAVVGLIAEGQTRRSILAYSERERAVPWRSFVIYNSWYELNINRNNDDDPLKRMTEAKCLPVIEAWNKELFTPYNIGVDAFVWDDGWDDFHSLWNFHIGFPKGFTLLDEKAKETNTGTGTWLGPVGGYGGAKAKRLAFWNKNHPENQVGNFQLSNKEYFDAFTNRCSQMVNSYDMRYFKLDGISDQYSSVGPGNEEDAEGIIKVLNTLRNSREDLFFNTTVGTWASPFWFHYTDAVWRQENDYDEIGVGNNRNKWITYRDRLVYQNFVKNSPLCPINSLMTHGLIVTKYGPPADMAHDNSTTTATEIKNEMRCAFACGSAMVELYVDNDLMSNIGKDKELWKELAGCIKWHRNNADVLADTHWVGGNPWDGAKANIYGWAAWTKEKQTLALRNPSSATTAYTNTLREVFEIPSYVKGKIKLDDAFVQRRLKNITTDSIDIDSIVKFNIPAYTVLVYNGRYAETGPTTSLQNTVESKKIPLKYLQKRVE